MKKKVLSAVLAASMCMSFLAGCGNSGSGDSGSSQSGETSKEASKETSKEADTSAAVDDSGSGPFHGDSHSVCPGAYVCRSV